MKITPVLSVAKMLVTGKRMKLILLGAQFGYLGYKYLKSRKRKGKSAKIAKAQK